jgi:hypothetical protein
LILIGFVFDVSDMGSKQAIGFIRGLIVIAMSRAMAVHADQILTSWFTKNSTVLARVVESNGAPAQTVWPSAWVADNNNDTNRYPPSYSDVQRIRYSSSNVFINANGLASYTMGPFLTKTGGLFGFWPLSQHYQLRITRNPTNTTTHAKHQGGVIGLMVNGVGIYDLGDAFSWKQSSSTDVMGTGDNVWLRDALAVEIVTFDPGFAHQPGLNGQYHYHAEPKALRYQLGDDMVATYNAQTNTFAYTESTNLPHHHSPILGWCYDGYPIYGPYGYAVTNSSTSGVTRMRTGFVLRNGQNGTTDLNATGRTTLGRWAAIAQGYTTATNPPIFPLTAAQYGPATTYTSGSGATLQTYTLGRYSGDYEYLGDLGKTNGVDFDLDQYNGRVCVTPEYPQGTYAYFCAIDANGTPVFPYMLSKQYFGVQNGGAAASFGDVVTNLFSGGPTNTQESVAATTVDPSSGSVTLTWNSVDGGTYKLEKSSDLATWSTVSTNLSASQNTTLTILTNADFVAGATQRYYRVTRTSLANYTP